MSDEIQFVKGLLVKAPNPKAPDFVKASISIKVAELQEWLSTQSGEWVNIDVKEARGGRWYAAVNTYKPKTDDDPKPSKPAVAPNNKGSFSDMDDDIPFLFNMNTVCGTEGKPSSMWRAKHGKSASIRIANNTEF